MNTELLILVDGEDNAIGTMAKLAVHEQGLLHRALSVFVFNTKGEWLLQQRAFNKYHSGGLWSNACCSHPRPGENVQAAAERRLQEEMGLKCRIAGSFNFTYKAAVGSGLTEYEYDHVFVAVTDEEPKPDKMEVAGWKYMGLAELEEDMQQQPRRYTEWFRLCMQQNKEQLLKTVKQY